MRSRNEQARSRWLPIGLGVAAGVLVAGILVLVALPWYLRGTSTESKTSFSDYEGTKLQGAAPGFRLVDQNGAARSLEHFRGKVVVLSLLDPDCTDICPVYAHHFRLAYQALGEDGAKVVFLAFNANDQKTSVEDVMAATKKWGLGEIPVWHFLTGSPEALRAAWNTYGMVGSGPVKPDKPQEKQHTPAIYVIDQAGQRRWYFSTNFEGAPAPSALIVKHVRALFAEEKRE